MNDEKSIWLRNIPCGSCGSSDANGLYSDGHTYCHKCKTYVHADGERKEEPLTTKDFTPYEVSYGPLPKRRLTEETCAKWRYGLTDTTPVLQVAQFFNKDGELVAQKTRGPNKEFAWRGDAKGCGLFGMHLWAPGGKSLIITEGELDAMTVSQLQGHRYPVVSVPNGAPAAKKAIHANLEFIESFDKVVFMFDSDAPGREAAAECAAELSPGKAYIATLPLKDASEMLMADRGPEVIDAFWKAVPYRPDGVVNGKDIWDKVIDFSNYESIPYPWEGLNRITKGARRGEMVLVCAGTGVGKSEVVRQAAYHFRKQGEVIGYVALEESVQRTALGFMGLHLGKRVFLDPRGEDQDTLREAFERTVGDGNYYLYDHFGSLESGNLVSKIRYMVKGCNCRTVVLDHISIVVSGSEIDDERKALDVIATSLKTLAMELNFRLIVIAHLKRTEGTSHEEGGRVKLNDIRGTGALAQLSNMVFALERNQQSEDEKNVTTLRVLKNRHTGETGVACYLKYDTETGILTETERKQTATDEQPVENY